MGLADWLGTSPAEHAYARAFRLARQGEYRQAVVALEEVLRDRPDDWGAHLWRGVFLSEAESYVPALKALEKAETLQPSNAALHLFRGRIHYDHGHYDEALAALAKAIAARPDDELAQAYRGLTWMAAGQATEARSALTERPLPSDSGLESRLLVQIETALAAYPEARPLEAHVAVQEGRAPSRSGEVRLPAWRQQLWRLRAALSVRAGAKAKQVTWHLQAGDYLFGRGAHPQACAEYTAALELAPDLEEARLGLADALLAAGEYERALTLIKALLEAHPDRPELAAGLGLAYLGLGNHRAALEHLAPVAQRSTFDFLPAYSCGLCALRLGEPLQARRWFERATAMVNPRIAAARLTELYRVQDAA